VIYSESCVGSAVYTNVSAIFLYSFSANDSSPYNRKLYINSQISISKWYDKLV